MNTTKKNEKKITNKMKIEVIFHFFDKHYDFSACSCCSFTIEFRFTVFLVFFFYVLLKFRSCAFSVLRSVLKQRR